MRVEFQKKLFTVDDFHRMAEVGILGENDRTELIEGEIIQMSPIGHRHAGCVNRFTSVLIRTFQERAVVSVQNPLRLNKYNEPQPDVVVFRWQGDYYASKPPGPEDTLFVVEVSDTTVRFDIRVKLPLYAAVGISELWIANLKENVLLVCREPGQKTYNSRLTLQRGDNVSPVAFPDITFKVEDLMG